MAKFSKLVAALICLAAVPAAADTVRIGWLSSTNEMVLARADGSLAKDLAAHNATLQWVGPFQAGSPSVEALNAGSIDVTSGSSTSAIASFAGHAPILVFEYRAMGEGSEGLIVPEGSPVHSVADLAGRSVATNRAGSGEYMLERALETNGIPAAKVKKIYLGPSDGAAAFASKQVDAWSIWDPYMAVALKNYGGHVLAQGKAIGDDNANVFIASREFAEHHRDLLMVVYNNILAENAWAQLHKHEAGAIWAKELKLPNELIDELGEHNAVPGGPVGPIEAATFQRVSDWFVNNKIVPAYGSTKDYLIDLGRK